MYNYFTSNEILLKLLTLSISKPINLLKDDIYVYIQAYLIRVNQIVNPPSTTKFWPVIYLDESEIKNINALLISVAFAILPRGTFSEYLLTKTLFCPL